MYRTPSDSVPQLIVPEVAMAITTTGCVVPRPEKGRSRKERMAAAISVILSATRSKQEENREDQPAPPAPPTHKGNEQDTALEWMLRLMG